jgi:hypothetical protein
MLCKILAQGLPDKTGGNNISQAKSKLLSDSVPVAIICVRTFGKDDLTDSILVKRFSVFIIR